jgi:hypothetical protein
VAPGQLGSEVKKKKGRGRGEADRRGPVVSVCGKKEKRRRRRRAAARKGCWASRPAGPKGKEGKFSFFSFSFSNSFQIKLFLLNSNQNPSNLFTKFYKLFRSHTSNQKPCKSK